MAPRWKRNKPPEPEQLGVEPGIVVVRAAVWLSSPVAKNQGREEINEKYETNKMKTVSTYFHSGREKKMMIETSSKVLLPPTNYERHRSAAASSSEAIGVPFFLGQSSSRRTQEKDVRLQFLLPFRVCQKGQLHLRKVQSIDRI